MRQARGKTHERYWEKLSSNKNQKHKKCKTEKNVQQKKTEIQIEKKKAKLKYKKIKKKSGER